MTQSNFQSKTKYLAGPWGNFAHKVDAKPTSSQINITQTFKRHRLILDSLTHMNHIYIAVYCVFVFFLSVSQIITRL